MNPILRRFIQIISCIVLASNLLVGCAKASPAPEEQLINSPFKSASDITNEGLLLFGEKYEKDPLKDVKLEFVQQSLERMSQVIALLPTELANTLLSQEELIPYIDRGNAFIVDGQKTLEFGEEISIDGFNSVYMDYVIGEQTPSCEATIEVNLVPTEKGIVFSKEAKDVLKLLIPELTMKEKDLEEGDEPLTLESLNTLCNETLKTREMNTIIAKETHSVTLWADLYEMEGNIFTISITNYEDFSTQP